MSLPSVEEAKTWVGSNVRDRDGVEIGQCVKVYADDATGVLEWLAVSVSEGRNVVVPAGGATGTGDGVQVSFTSQQVLGAPSTESLEHVQTAEEAALYEHYGVPYSAAESPTLLPADEADEAVAAGSDTLGEPVSDRDTEDIPVVAPVPPDIPAPSYEVSPPTTVSGGSSPAFGASAGASKAPVAAVAAAGGLAAAAVLARRLMPSRRQRPVARTSRASKAAVSRAERAGRRSGKTATRSAATAAEAMRRASLQAQAVAARTGTQATQATDNVSRTVSRASRSAVQGALAATSAASLAGKRSTGQARQVGSQLAEGADHLTHDVLSAARRSGTGTARAVAGTVAPVTDAAATVAHTGRTTMGLIRNAVILGAGYVLGTRAGRERYEQIRDKAQQVWQRPQVQQASQKVKGTVSQRLPGGSGGTRAYDDVASYPATPTIVTSETVDPTFPTTPRP